MKERLYIKGRSDLKILEIKLEEILTFFINKNSPHWNLLWLDGVGHSKEDNIMRLINNINKSEKGTIYKVDELIELSKKFFQELEVLIVGDKSFKKLKKYNSDKEMREECQYTVELVDGSYWDITSNDVDFLIYLKNNFDGVEVISEL